MDLLLNNSSESDLIITLGLIVPLNINWFSWVYLASSIFRSITFFYITYLNYYLDLCRPLYYFIIVFWFKVPALAIGLILYLIAMFCSLFDSIFLAYSISSLATVGFIVPSKWRLMYWFWSFDRYLPFLDVKMFWNLMWGS